MVEEKWDIEKRNPLDVAIDLWELIAEYPDDAYGIFEIKREVVDGIGCTSKWAHHCPLCEAYIDDDCMGCPIKESLSGLRFACECDDNCPYRKMVYAVDEDGDDEHRLDFKQQDAREFLEFLKSLKEQNGDENERNQNDQEKGA